MTNHDDPELSGEGLATSGFSGGTSPLWMVSNAPALNELVGALQSFRHTLDAAPSAHENEPRRLVFSKARIAAARAEFSEMIRRGERDLHVLAGALARRLLGTFHLRSVVIGEIEKTHERFTLSVDVSEADVIGTTDLDLGNRVLARLAISEQRGWLRASLVSSVVEYEAESPNEHSVYRILTRIKAEEEIWNKVADEIFDLDSIVLRDKQLRHLGRYVKDVFGIKIVVGTPEEARAVQRTLEGGAGACLELDGRPLTFVEVKDYLSRPSRKQSGWSALKSVVRWGERTFEIQVQPLSNFLHEREKLTKESHASFKTTRERVRDGIAARLPLFGFYRALLRWLFLDSTSEPPLHEGVEIVLSE